MHVLGAADLVAPLLGAGVHAGVQVGVVEDDGVGVEHGPHGGAAAVGEDAAEHLAVPVEALQALLKRDNVEEEESGCVLGLEPNTGLCVNKGFTLYK